MDYPKLGDFAVRLNVVGRASPRWKGAKNATKADRLNQRLSELRAQNVRRAVEEILKSELPSLPIEVPSKGAGSHERFPTVSEDNAEVDRSVLVTVELTTTQPAYKFQPCGPRRIYVPSKSWSLRVLSMVRAAGFGYVQIFPRVLLRNNSSGKRIVLSGWLTGGGSAMSVKDSFKISKPNPSSLKPIGSEVDFSTREALDFDNFKSVSARVGKAEVSFGLKTMMTYLVFLDLNTHPNLLIFDHKNLGLGLIKADAFLVAGKLSMEGTSPGDFLEFPTPMILSRPRPLSIGTPTGYSSAFPLEKPICTI